MENIRQKIAEIITHTHKTPLEQADEILLLFSVVEQSEQLPTECIEHWEGSYYCSKPKGSCKKCI